MPIKISHQFDAGAIEVIRAEQPDAIELNLRKDSHAEVLQWFYFRLQGARGQACTMRLLNASQAAFAGGWQSYQAVASYDRENWFRVPTSYDGKVLTIRHAPERDSIYYAYFEPYSWERHLRLLGRVEAEPGTRVLDIGSTVDGRDMNVAVIGNPDARKKIWVIARQHPGETMAEWFVEGMLDALLDRHNPHARHLLQKAVFYVVPNMNPDGSVRGNLRTNAAGANLNREWMQPSPERSPEVLAVRNMMHEVGCDLFLDVHGDETLPYVFVAGCEMLEGFTATQQAEQQAFIDSYVRASRDFQTAHGYEAGKYRQEMLQLASKYVGHTFKCISLTLEMPFKDNADLPDPAVGWNGARSARLGAAVLQPMLDALERS
ncbi:M14-type cytosolic carboxypeptidase [Noviherbaspirillum sp. CPCC 100848]|uniref:M14-type cytosolic carboxypeptidase n=1 Tax=Noviherbaspirillum album TaxID=3080276 RepID=A0ABU6JHY8_9BURK|nr:M14-type cytosolic carboxypeptidase [Noviherbaspirillum sp. CPCC 100848]MEC4723274.1 M14-type cytosolic carboxypeptidase [Noviherbaspirillum sp. CPCC 100848]